VQTPLTELIGSVTVLALGPAFDRLVPRRHKAHIHDWLTKVWLRLDDMPVPEYPVSIAHATLAASLRALGGDWISKRAVARYLLASGLLTLIAVASGLHLSTIALHQAIAPWFAKMLTANKAKGLSAGDVQLLIGTMDHFQPWSFVFKNPRWFAFMLAFNALFDMASIACTILFLRAMVRHGTRSAPMFVFMDMVATTACAVGSLIAGLWASGSVHMAQGIAATKPERAMAITNYISALIVSAPYSLTTLLPTAAFLAAIALAYAGRIVLATSRQAGLVLIERITEDPAASSSPATVLTTAVWLLLVVYRLTHYLGTLWW
jgi:hypothetical protein